MDCQKKSLLFRCEKQRFLVSRGSCDEQPMDDVVNQAVPIWGLEHLLTGKPHNFRFCYDVC